MTRQGDTPRSFVVDRVDGGIPLKRNRVHLRPSVEDWSMRRSRGEAGDSVISDTEEEEQLAPTPEMQHKANSVDTENTVTQEGTSVRRSTRPRQQTQFFQAGGR